MGSAPLLQRWVVACCVGGRIFALTVNGHVFLDASKLDRAWSKLLFAPLEAAGLWRFKWCWAETCWTCGLHERVLLQFGLLLNAAVWAVRRLESPRRCKLLLQMASWTWFYVGFNLLNAKMQPIVRVKPSFFPNFLFNATCLLQAKKELSPPRRRVGREHAFYTSSFQLKTI